MSLQKIYMSRILVMICDDNFYGWDELLKSPSLGWKAQEAQEGHNLCIEARKRGNGVPYF